MKLEIYALFIIFIIFIRTLTYTKVQRVTIESVMCEPGFFSIGEVAKQVGIGIETVRFYERKGLVEPSRRRDGGHRQFTAKDIDQLLFVKRAQRLSFSLKEIKNLLDFINSDILSREKLVRKLEGKAEQIREQIREGEETLVMMKELINLCQERKSFPRSGDCVLDVFQELDDSSKTN